MYGNDLRAHLRRCLRLAGANVQEVFRAAIEKHGLPKKEMLTKLGIRGGFQ